MPSVATKHLFVTISHPAVDSLKGTSEYLDYVKKSVKRHLIIKELGKNGDHPHYHIYAEEDEAKRADNYKQCLIRKYFTTLQGNHRRYTIVVKAVTNLNKLIGGYFIKEDNHTIISNKNVNLDQIKKMVKSSSSKITYKFISFNELPFFLINYIDENNIEMVPKETEEKAIKSNTKGDLLQIRRTIFDKSVDTLWMQLFRLKYNMHAYDNKKDVIKEYLFNNYYHKFII